MSFQVFGLGRLILGIGGYVGIFSACFGLVCELNLPVWAAPADGTIEGRVIYQMDPRRPWLGSRSYIKYASRGHLADAVVALQLKTPKGGAPRRMPILAHVDQKDFRFVPETIAIQAGDRVEFSNNDSQVHNVRTYDGDHPFNVNTSIGGQYTHRFEIAGGIRRPIQIGCSYHGQMQAWIFVFAHPHFQVTGEDGKFRLSGIPPGEYDLEVAHPAGNLRAKTKVVVRDGTTTHTEITMTPDNLVEPRP